MKCHLKLTVPLAALASVILLEAAPPTNSPAYRRLQERRAKAAIKTQAATNAPVAPPKPAQPAPTLGPVYKLQLPGGPLITITSTSTFTPGQLRRWLHAASVSPSVDRSPGSKR